MAWLNIFEFMTVCVLHNQSLYGTFSCYLLHIFVI